ncbi:hypothetical protein JYU34_008600 [Plutella xylostella]|uniref:Uncharacterized protein n=1 Tax=Plutella xylostella TaxID=51655 RepID=A0ABQ7QLB3_PLUXY|nr:hypothetical protein JYU34_008600 [Plutella xylostella]
MTEAEEYKYDQWRYLQPPRRLRRACCPRSNLASCARAANEVINARGRAARARQSPAARPPRRIARPPHASLTQESHPTGSRSDRVSAPLW